MGNCCSAKSQAELPPEYWLEDNLIPSLQHNEIERVLINENKQNDRRHNIIPSLKTPLISVFLIVKLMAFKWAPTVATYT